MPVGSVCRGELQSRWQQGNKFGAAMGIVLETVQTVDGGRWEKPSLCLPNFAIFQIPLFPAPLFLGHSFLSVTVVSSLFFFLFSSPSVFFFFFCTYIISQFMKGYPACIYLLINLFPIPLPHISIFDPKSFPWH